MKQDVPLRGESKHNNRGNQKRTTTTQHRQKETRTIYRKGQGTQKRTIKGGTDSETQVMKSWGKKGGKRM